MSQLSLWWTSRWLPCAGCQPTNGRWCQFKHQQQSPIWGAVKKETVLVGTGQQWYNMTVIKHCCGAAVRLPREPGRPGTGPSSARQLHSAMWWDVFHGSAAAQKHILQSAVESPLNEQRGAGLYGQMSRPWFLIDLSSCKGGCQILTIWLVWRHYSNLSE